jgi:hypothetical protein
MSSSERNSLTKHMWRQSRTCTYIVDKNTMRRHSSSGLGLDALNAAVNVILMINSDFLYSINWLVFVMEVQCVHYEVGTECLCICVMYDLNL